MTDQRNATPVNSKLKQHSKEPTPNMMHCFASDEGEDYVNQLNVDAIKTEKPTMNAVSIGQKNATLVNSKLKQHSKEPTPNMMYCFASGEDEGYVTERNGDVVKAEKQCSVSSAEKTNGSTGGCLKIADASKDIDG